ncbi:type VII toxin-antitoxin system MntA family adenylyltransferase antitoxin [Maridesulfovibrio sp.]|uniref:type VII toxin-antitoxin system MntA family adenylyltransferase antitoxin n=1 Tax=Maridesulfovibrio sp. TaxID=2795000 RepID=UPI002A18AC8B|nr:nucleotidyltransferase domain-containing protein [Maridesulfovibrio sp.]
MGPFLFWLIGPIVLDFTLENHNAGWYIKFMMRMGIKKTSKLAALLEKQDDLEVGILFGSTVTGSNRPDSDIDVAVLGSSLLSYERRMQLRALISIEMGREVDLIDLMNCHGLLLQQILTTGKPLFGQDSLLLAQTANRMLVEQADYEPLRNRLVLANLKRGFSESKSY